MTTNRLLLIVLLALLLYLWRRSRTLGTPDGRVLVPVSGSIDPLQLEIEQWLQLHDNNGN